MAKYQARLVPQADDFTKVFKVPQAVMNGAHTFDEIADYFGMVGRQGRYYRLAAVIVGFVNDEQRNNAQITNLGKQYVNANSQDQAVLRRTAIISNGFMRAAIERFRADGTWTNSDIVGFIQSNSDATLSTIPRRQNSVRNWLVAAGFATQNGSSIDANETVIDSSLAPPDSGDSLDVGELSPKAREQYESHELQIPDSEFDPTSITDGREQTFRRINLRKGQPKFRDSLIAAYDAKCAISGYDAVNALEAAHIMPYQGEDTNHPGNGILLRADLHTLFDLGLIAIDDVEMTVIISPTLQSTEYGQFSGVKIHLPSERTLRPSSEALREHRDSFDL
jgi:hypothetical protein